MAEGGGSQDNQGHSLTSGSEFVFDFYCELCRDDGRNEEADGYCQDCREYLCNLCINGHKRSRPTRHHDVLDRDAMPKDTPLSQDRISKDISTKCKSHTNKTVEFYCVPHKTLGCSTCFATVHRNCDAIESIYDKSENIIDSQEYKSLATSLADIEQRTHTMIDKSQNGVASLEQSCLDSIKDIRNLKKELVAMFEELEQNLITQVETMTSTDKANIERLYTTLREIAQAANTLKSEFGGLANSKRACQLYVQMKERDSDVSSLEDKLRTTERSFEFKQFKFEPNNDIKEAIKSSGIGKLIQLSSTQKVNDYDLQKNDASSTATHVADINVRSNNDTCTSSIMGSAVLTETSLIMADNSNSSLKLVDTSSNKLKCDLKVSARPFSVAVTTNKQVAVSTYGEGKIFLVNVTDTLSLEKEISVTSDCRGVAYTQDKLIITSFSSKCLQVLDIKGNGVKPLQKITFNSNKFGYPRHACVSNDGETMYASNYSNKTVMQLTFGGEVKAVYSGSENPHDLCTDHCGNLYFADGISRTVQMLTADCSKIKDVLTRADGIDKEVMSVSHCKSQNRLYVGMNGSDVIKVYQLQ